MHAAKSTESSRKTYLSRLNLDTLTKFELAFVPLLLQISVNIVKFNCDSLVINGQITVFNQITREEDLCDFGKNKTFEIQIVSDDIERKELFDKQYVNCLLMDSNLKLKFKFQVPKSSVQFEKLDRRLRFIFDENGTLSRCEPM